MPSTERAAFLASLSPAEKYEALFAWEALWARPEQVEPPGDWEIWFLLAGRGFGKTRTGAEWVRKQVEGGEMRRLALIAPTAADYRDVMVEGDSGLLTISRPDFMPDWEPSKRRLTWPNGAIATCYAAETPNRLRGPQHDGFWGDEPAFWKYPSETFDNLQFGLRLGLHPRGVLTSTPKPIRLVRDILQDPATVVTGGSTYDNALNLAPRALRRLRRKYEGTTLGRQELYAELLSEVPGALWRRATIDRLRVEPALLPEMFRIVIAIDPAASSSDEADETGIVAAGLGTDYHGYVLRDRSGRFHPQEWAQRAIDLYRELKADLIVGEVNNGGEMVQTIIATIDPRIPFKAIHASRGKHVRAEPVAALYEQERVHHLRLGPMEDEAGRLIPAFEDLEDQMCTWTSDMKESPDRMDALVYALTEVLLADDEADIVGWDEPYSISPV